MPGVGYMRRQRADWVLTAEAGSVARARTLIAQRCHDLPTESLDVLLLLTSELVTNAVRHGTGPVGVHVDWGDGDVRVEVEDRSPHWPVVQAMDRDALKGRGLILVDGLSSGWGVLAQEIGKSVWFTCRAH
jgi:anti-sigma regulatory factor (Ser/Thr protein kinase)